MKRLETPKKPKKKKKKKKKAPKKEVAKPRTNKNNGLKQSEKAPKICPKIGAETTQILPKIGKKSGRKQPKITIKIRTAKMSEMLIFLMLSDDLKGNYAYFEVPYNGKDNDDYVNGEGFCCSQNTALRVGIGIGNVNYEKMQYYYHPDHLGSSSYITNLDGEIVQHVEYVPFGEVFIEERNNSWNTPYLFNGKELDEETGLYYYGARYYNPRESVWLSTNPLSGYNPIMEVEHYIDGQHNEGVYNSFNLNTYGYCYQSPIILIDPNGKQVWTRILGGVKAIGGALEMVAGGALLVTPEPTLATKAAGVVVAVHGADVASSGLRQMWTGEEENSLTSQGLQAAGMSKQNAEIVDASISIIGSGSAGALRNASKVGTVTSGTAKANTGELPWNEISGRLREAAKTKGNFGMGTATESEAMQLGESWVGKGARLSKDGTSLVSKDELKIFRLPKYKGRINKTQANFEWKTEVGGKPVGNGHLDIK